MEPVLILGCGYTGARVAARLAKRGMKVYATTRNARNLQIHGVEVLGLRLNEPGCLQKLAERLPSNLRVLHSLPVIEGREYTHAVVEALGPKAKRWVYLSTTGVYGKQRQVNESTDPQPSTLRERLRVEAETAIQCSGASWMILRPAAIYGPGRGVHTSLQQGRFHLFGDGSNYVSRIHVEDLAKLAAEALLSEHSGAWPVADEDPSQSIEIVKFCCNLLGLPVPPSASEGELSETRRANRKVDGRAVFRLLNVELLYPNYRMGIPASITEEKLQATPHRQG